MVNKLKYFLLLCVFALGVNAQDNLSALLPMPQKVELKKGKHFCFDKAGAIECYMSDSLFIIDHSVFSNIGKDCVLYVPKGSKDAYKKTKGWNLFNKIEEM